MHVVTIVAVILSDMAYSTSMASKKQCSAISRPAKNWRWLQDLHTVPMVGISTYIVHNSRMVAAL